MVNFNLRFFKDHSHTPYVILLLKYLEKWKHEVGLYSVALSSVSKMAMSWHVSVKTFNQAIYTIYTFM